MHAVGVDGCKAGWCVVQCAHEQYTMELLPEFSQIISHPDAELALVDIPLGLGSKAIPRDLDYVARKSLASKRQSSLFIPPVREAIKAANYPEAKEMNQKITGKKISIQSWNISNKIREADIYMLNNPQMRSGIHEAHPEICFKFLNLGEDLCYSKNAPERKGIEERIDILKRYEINAFSLVKNFSQRYPSKMVKADDIVDALCLAVTAKLGLLHGFRQISGSSAHDAHGIEMSLYYYDPKVNEHPSEKL